MAIKDNSTIIIKSQIPQEKGSSIRIKVPKITNKETRKRK